VINNIALLLSGVVRHRNLRNILDRCHPRGGARGALPPRFDRYATRASSKRGRCRSHPR
jgi:hypothetical protein